MVWRMKNMNCVLVGVSDRSTLWREGKIKEKNYEKFILHYAKFLKKHFENVIVTPDDGVYTDIALKFGQITKKKPIAYYPDKDTFYGIEHIKDNFEKYEIKPIDGDWYKLNADLTKQAICVICLGFTPGVLIEISFIKYHQKYGKYKDPRLKNIHLFIDKKTIKQKLPLSFEEQINNLYYYKDLKELEKIILEKKEILKM
jgi:hypothetical protein